MTSSSIRIRSLSPGRSFFPDMRSALTAGLTVAALLAATLGAHAQSAASAQEPTAQAAAAALAPAQQQPPATPAAPAAKTRKKTRERKEKVVQSKDTRKEEKKEKKDSKAAFPLASQDSLLPDKELYDKAETAIDHGHFDVGRLDLQTLLNTYPDSQYLMRAKLAVADSWFKEGGSAALTQAEQEYKDFITFFPNAPEAALAQMRVGDIYFEQMEKPDRDYSKAVHAEQEYRLMLQQFPDSTLVPQATQRLREVQEVLATRQAEVAAFYATRMDWPATIARYQTVVDTYPLYSHMDEVLIGLGDAYEGEANAVRTLRLPEGPKAQLEKTYDSQAAAAYRKVVLEHSAAPHVDDAKDRLAAMGLPIPTPTAAQVAASEKLENSRAQYNLSNRMKLLFLRTPDTVQAATVGAPPLTDATPTYAPTITRTIINDFNSALNPHAAHASETATSAPETTPAEAAPAEDAQAPAATPASTAPLAFQEVPTAGQASAPPVNTDVQEAAPATQPATGSGVGIQIVQHPSGTPAPAPQPGAVPPAFPGSSAPPAAEPQSAQPQAAQPAAQPSDNGGLAPVGPANTTPMAPIEKAAPQPDAINEAPAGGPQPVVQPSTGKKNPKPAFDKSEESSSKHKKKKGLGKLNPF